MEMLKLTGSVAVKVFAIGLFAAGIIVGTTMFFQKEDIKTAGPVIQEKINDYIDNKEITLQKEMINTVYLPLTEENYTDVIDAGSVK